jgi:hypothetical protein
MMSWRTRSGHSRRAGTAHHLAGEAFRGGAGERVRHRADRIALGDAAEIALVLVGAQRGRVFLLDDLGGQEEGPPVERDHRNFDVMAGDEGLDDGVMALAVERRDGADNALAVLRR